MVGRVVDALGRPVDGLGPIHTTKSRKVEIVAPGIIKRQPVEGAASRPASRRSIR